MIINWFFIILGNFFRKDPQILKERIHKRFFLRWYGRCTFQYRNGNQTSTFVYTKNEKRNYQGLNSRLFIRLYSPINNYTKKQTSEIILLPRYIDMPKLIITPKLRYKFINVLVICRLHPLFLRSLKYHENFKKSWNILSFENRCLLIISIASIITAIATILKE